MTVYPWAWMPLFCFVMVSSFIVINLVIAVICDAVAGMQHEEQVIVMKKMESIVEHHATPAHTYTTAREIAQLEAKIDYLTDLVLLLQQQQHPQRQEQPAAELRPIS